MLNRQKLKSLIQMKSKETKLPMQQLYGLYAMDQLISQLSQTKYADNLIVKGGYLLTSTYGLEYRATGDLDFTVKDLKLNKSNILKMIKSIDYQTNTYYFEFKALKKTREIINFEAYELKLIFHNDGNKIPLNIDLTTGEDLIQVNMNDKVKSIFSDNEYNISSYPIEQILSDKFYTLLSYGKNDDTNSRMKDYYDLYLLTKTNRNIDLRKVNIGLNKIMNQRDYFIDINEYFPIINFLSESKKQEKLWLRYQKRTIYADNLKFDDVMNQIKKFSNKLINESTKPDDNGRVL